MIIQKERLNRTIHTNRRVISGNGRQKKEASQSSAIAENRSLRKRQPIRDTVDQKMPSDRQPQNIQNARSSPFNIVQMLLPIVWT